MNIENELAFGEYVSIPIRTEKTEPCEWCSGNVSRYFDVNWYDFVGNAHKGAVNYCPNCGRSLSGMDSIDT